MLWRFTDNEGEKPPFPKETKKSLLQMAQLWEIRLEENYIFICPNIPKTWRSRTVWGGEETQPDQADVSVGSRMQGEESWNMGSDDVIHLLLARTFTYRKMSQGFSI